MSLRLSRCAAVLCLFLGLLLARPSAAYSVLSHEEVVDMAWKDHIVPLLRARFPGITDDDLRRAHAYAYGGSVIQDLGYYPFGSHYFSDLVHYVRPNDFVTNLLHDSRTPDEYAFALGALAHYCGDTVGHPYINRLTAEQNPRLSDRLGPIVTYDQDPVAHLHTEFGFDVVEVAHSRYSQENYRDFIGFQVAKDLLNRAFFDTYGIPVDRILPHEDLAISTYRHAVSGLIPQMTRVAYLNLKDDIQQATPGIEKRKFLYRLNQTEYNREFGTGYTHTGIGTHVFAFFIRLLPKIGPLRALRITVPTPGQQTVYLKSINATEDQFRAYLADFHADPAPLPPPTQQDAADAKKAADTMAANAQNVAARAEKAEDPAEQALRQQQADAIATRAAHAAVSAQRTQARVDAVEAGATPKQALVQTAPDAAHPVAQAAAAAQALPQGAPIAPPTTPTLPELDMDTGRPLSVGEYPLADLTWAQLLHDLVHPESPTHPIPGAARQSTASSGQAAGQSRPGQATASGGDAASTGAIDPELATDIERFYAHRSTLPPIPPREKDAKKLAAVFPQVQADLAILRQRMASTPAASTPVTTR